MATKIVNMLGGVYLSVIGRWPEISIGDVTLLHQDGGREAAKKDTVEKVRVEKRLLCVIEPE